MLTSGVRQFRHWKEAGVLADYHVLFSRYVDTDGWDMMALLTFASYAGMEKWQQVESARPAGLSADTLALTLVVNSYPVRLARRNASQISPPQPVYLVIPYGASGGAPENLDGSIEDGGLASYGLYQRRFGAARPWDSLLVLEFPSEEVLGAREKMLAKDQSGQAVVADELTISR